MLGDCGGYGVVVKRGHQTSRERQLGLIPPLLTAGLSMSWDIGLRVKRWEQRSIEKEATSSWS